MTHCNGFSCTWIVLVAVEARPGERLAPLALIAKDVSSNRIVEIGVPKLRGVRRPPYPTGPQALLATINATEVVGLHLALGWRMPERIIDLMVEFRNAVGSTRHMNVGGLAGALAYYGQPAVNGLASGKSPDAMRRRLVALAELFAAMRPSIDLGRALLRGRYLCAVTHIQSAGVPLDRDILSRLSDNWPGIRRRIVEIVDSSFGVYQGHRFDASAFAGWLEQRGFDWPILPSGQLDLGDDAFREMSRAYPEVRPLKELRTTLTDVDPNTLSVGHDGRNRTPLNPFASRTGRNQPSAKASVLGSAAWVRNLICPSPGTALALLDWQQQEFGIAAALSGDAAMQAAYLSGDPYLAIAIGASAAPADATAVTHPQVRDRFKACALGVQYGMGAGRLARQLGASRIDAIELIRAHKNACPRFWSWSDATETQGLLHRELWSVLGWRLAIGADANPRSLRNFPMQANGAEMLRLACCLATEAGITVCAPIHDALLIEAPLREIAANVAAVSQMMAEASATVLDGFALRTSVRVVRSPEHWTDARGQAVWAAVQNVLKANRAPAHQRDKTCSSANSRPISLYVSKKDGAHAAD